MTAMAMLDGVQPQQRARIIEARAAFTASPLTATDVSTLAARVLRGRRAVY